MISIKKNLTSDNIKFSILSTVLRQAAMVT